MKHLEEAADAVRAALAGQPWFVDVAFVLSGLVVYTKDVQPGDPRTDKLRRETGVPVVFRNADDKPVWHPSRRTGKGRPRHKQKGK